VRLRRRQTCPTAAAQGASIPFSDPSLALEARYGLVVTDYLGHYEGQELLREYGVQSRISRQAP
jgi:hypothetical protein